MSYDHVNKPCAILLCVHPKYEDLIVSFIGYSQQNIVVLSNVFVLLNLLAV